jgi:hypothetical protein
MRRFSQRLRLVAALLALAGPAIAGSPDPLDAPGRPPAADSGVALQLEVVRNGQDIGLMAVSTSPPRN